MTILTNIAIALTRKYHKDERIIFADGVLSKLAMSLKGQRIAGTIIPADQTHIFTKVPEAHTTHYCYGFKVLDGELVCNIEILNNTQGNFLKKLIPMTVKENKGYFGLVGKLSCSNTPVDHRLHCHSIELFNVSFMQA